MYADLEKIEARGKRKKEKSKGLFSSFGKKDEPEPEPKQEAMPVEAAPETEPAPVPEPVFVEPKTVAEAPKHVPPPQPVAESPKPIPTPPPAHAREAPAPKPVDGEWKPLTGGKLKKAEEELVAYKKWLNHGFKSGVLTKQQCVDMVRKKEIELGLRPSK
jgi:hypothetical protein